MIRRPSPTPGAARALIAAAAAAAVLTAACGTDPAPSSSVSMEPSPALTVAVPAAVAHTTTEAPSPVVSVEVPESSEPVPEPVDSAGPAAATAVAAETAPAAAATAPAAATFPPAGAPGAVARWTVEIVGSLPHDRSAFTQGLEMAGGALYESTGLWGRSSLRRLDPATGEVTARVDLEGDLFGEGLTVAGDRIVQLTWQSGTAIVYDRHTLTEVRRHRYEGEGWGLCLRGDELIMSDGSDLLARRDPDTFELIGTVAVTAEGYGGRLDHLNELECIDGLVMANVWQTDRLLVIDPGSGRVVAVIDAGPLVDRARASDSGIDVLNGVAAIGDGTLWMTGKLWPDLYRVRIVEEP